MGNGKFEIDLKKAMELLLNNTQSDYGTINVIELAKDLFEHLKEESGGNTTDAEIIDELLEDYEEPNDLDIVSTAIQTTADDYQSQIDDLTKENNSYEERIPNLKQNIETKDKHIRILKQQLERAKNG